MVRMERLELSRVAPLEPKSSASTNFATFAHLIEKSLVLKFDPAPNINNWDFRR